MTNNAGFKVWPAGEEALVALKPPYRQEIRAQDLIGRSHECIAPRKIPRLVEFVEVLPKSGSGKVVWCESQEREARGKSITFWSLRLEHMELVGERLIPAPISATWNALNDPEVLKSCIAGCESLENVQPDTLAVVLALRIGPVSARFKGTLKLSNIQAPHSYLVSFEGQGGAAGFGKGAADVSLAEEGKQTRLRYSARAQIGGRLAQVGSRLVDAAASKITEDFFSAFEARLRPATAEATTEATANEPAVLGKTGSPAKFWWWVLFAAIAAAVAFALWR
jgi:hypothetical protein